jgi:LPS O-antigen subunit length determinant protein (WzzB/FepE family)
MDNNTPDQQMLNQYFYGIDLRELFGVLWAGKIKIVAITAVFAIASVINALSVPNQYKATVLLYPAQSSGGGLSGALGQLGGLAAMAGVSLGGGSEAQVAQVIMTSRSFIEGFIESNDLAVEISAVKGWEEETNRLLINNDTYDVENKKWVLEDGPPSSWALFKAFSARITVSEDKSGFISVSIGHVSPYIAKQWIDLYVAGINEYMQKRQIARVTRNIEYLEAQIKKTSIAEMQEVLYTIIEEQIKSKMLAEASPDYAFVAVSPSMVPEEKLQPNRVSTYIFGTLLGGVLSVLLVLVMHYGRKLGS